MERWEKRERGGNGISGPSFKGGHYDNKELKYLRENYLDMGIEELEEGLNRSGYGISQKLKRLAKESPKEWDMSRIHALLGKQQRIYRGLDTDGYNPNKIWSSRSKTELYAQYEKCSLRDLELKLGRGGYGIVQELRGLAKENPESWNKERIDCLYAEAHGDYMQSRSKPRYEGSSYSKEKREIFNKMLEREGKWSERDTVILANTYFTHNWLELSKIFRLKDIDLTTKLREFKQDNNMWDAERIEELEKESEEYSLEELKEDTLKFFIPGLYNTKLRRNPEIDELVEQNLNMRQIGDKLNISKQAVSLYIISRGLKKWYGTRKRMNKITP